MRKILLPILILFALPAFAQTTSLTINVTDAGGQAWNNGTWTANLQSATGGPNPPFYIKGTTTPVPSQSQAGSLGASGSATFTVTPNASIAPVTTVWQVSVCPNASSPCYTVPLTVGGSTQTSDIQPPEISIAISGKTTFAYADAEIKPPQKGDQYWNVTLNESRQWSGSAWVALPISPNPNDAIQYVSANGNDSNDGLSWGTAKATVQAAINAAGANGTVLVASSYAATVTSTITISNNHVTLECQKGATITQGMAAGIIQTTGSYDTIEGCNWVGYSTSPATGAVLSASNDSLINNTFSGFGGNGAIYMSGAVNPLVSGNRISGGSGIFGEANTTGAIIEGNEVSATGSSSAIAFHSTTSGDTVSATIASNRLSNAGGLCVEVGAFGGNAAQHIIISGNHCNLTANGAGGISIGSDTTGFSETGNVVDAQGFSSTIALFECVNCSDGAVSGNSAISGTQSNSVTFYDIDANNGNAEHVAFTGNSAVGTFSGTALAHCFYVIDNTAYTVSDVTYSGNVCSVSGTGGSGYVVWVQSNNSGATVENISIVGNTIDNGITADYAIATDKASGTLTNVSIRGNMISASFPLLAAAGSLSSSDVAAAFASYAACASGLEGSVAAITDSTTVTFNATITGSGTNHVHGYCNGINWVVQ